MSWSQSEVGGNVLASIVPLLINRGVCFDLIFGTRQNLSSYLRLAKIKIKVSMLFET